jgi:hypothetical protein
MKSNSARYPITIAGQKLILQFDTSDAETKKGVRLQFVMEQDPSDPRDKDDLKNKLSVVLQKKFGESGIVIDYDERNPYINVIAFIVPISSIASILIEILRS